MASGPRTQRDPTPVTRKRIGRGDIFYANLNPVVGSEQGGVRPVLVLQNDVGNRHSPTTIVAPITSRRRKRSLPTHVELSGGQAGLARDSVVLLEQVRTIDRRRLKERVCRLDAELMARVEAALAASIGAGRI